MIIQPARGDAEKVIHTAVKSLKVDVITVVRMLLTSTERTSEISVADLNSDFCVSMQCFTI